jgi:hypothetical protein
MEEHLEQQLLMDEMIENQNFKKLSIEEQEFIKLEKFMNPITGQKENKVSS